MSDTPRNDALRKMVATNPKNMVGILLAKHKQLERELSLKSCSKCTSEYCCHQTNGELCAEVQRLKAELAALKNSLTPEP